MAEPVVSSRNDLLCGCSVVVVSLRLGGAINTLHISTHQCPSNVGTEKGQQIAFCD